MIVIYKKDMSDESIIQNLEDANCSEHTISCFMNCYKRSDAQGVEKVLRTHRRELLKQVHEQQKCIDCLDYLKYQLEQDENKKTGK